MRRRRRHLHLDVLESRLCLTAPTIYPGSPITLPSGSWTPTPFMSSPIFADLDNSGRDELIAPAAGGKLIAFNTDSNGGIHVFQVYNTGSNVDIMSTPIVVTAPGGRKEVFAALAHDVNNPGAQEDGRVFGWDAVTGQLLPGWPQSSGRGLDNTTGVIGPLASGDLDGDGIPEIVVTSYSNQITAFRLNGTKLWSYDANDTIESGAVIGDINKDGKAEVVFGSDSSQSPYFQNGGFINILSNQGQALYRYHVGETIWSSPVLADLYGDGNLEIIVGTGLAFSENSNPAVAGPATAAGDAIYAINYQGQTLPGWPYRTTSDLTQKRSTYPSPAVADLLGNGQLEIVEEDRGGYLHVVQANGQPLPGWEGGKLISPAGQVQSVDNYASPIIADIDGSGKQEIIASNGAYLVAFDAQGNKTDLTQYDVPGAKLNAPAVGHFDPNGGLEMAEVSNLFGGTGYPNSVNIYQLPSGSAAPAWPMMRRTASAFAVQYSQSYLKGFVTNVFQGFMGAAPTTDQLNQFVGNLSVGNYTPFQFAHAIAATPQARIHFADVVYPAILGRQPTAAERQNLVTVLNRATEEQVMATLLQSAEFAKRAGSNANKINLLYQATFGRAATSNEITAWSRVLASGYPFNSLVNQFLEGEAAITRRLVAFANAAHVGIPPDALTAILYDTHRGRHEEDIYADLIASGGRYAATHQLSSWVRTIYRDILMREAQPIEVAYWMRQLDAGTLSTSRFANILVNSPEARTQFVREQFIKYLGRDPGAGAASSLAGYASREALITTVVGSDEYFKKNGGTNASYIQAAYRDIAGINPVPSDALNNWLKQLNSGTPRGVLASQLLQSGAYYDSVVVADLFRYLPDESLGVLRTGLGNPNSGQAVNPNPAAVANLVNQLQHGLTTTQLVANLVSYGPYISNSRYDKGLYRSIGIWS